MNAKVSSIDRLWDFTLPCELEQSQAWVLSAMQKQGPALVRLLWRILGCEQDVCDAYQETFLKLAHYDFGAKPEKIKAYLFKTATNTAISILRRKALHNKLIQNIAVNNRSVSQELPDFDHQDTCKKLRKAVTKLPDHLRDVVVLRDFGEMNYRKVAKILNITEATARVYRCKAVQLLAVWLDDEKTK